MNKKLGTVAIATAAALILVGCSTNEPAAEGGTDITMWLMGGDTPDELRDYLKTEYADATGGTLTIEEQAWGDALAKLTTALPDSENTPDVVEIGNTQTPAFTTAGAFLDLTEHYEALGGASSLPRHWAPTQLVSAPSQACRRSISAARRVRSGRAPMATGSSFVQSFAPAEA